MQQGYSTQEVAKLLTISVPTVYNLETRGILKKLEDPHRLRDAVYYPKELVEQLIEEKKQLDEAGPSITEFAKKMNTNPRKVREGIKELGMEVPAVPSTLRSLKMRSALTPEQERQLEEHLNLQKKTRVKRNHFYNPFMDLALYQAFQIAGEQQVRLAQNKEKVFGFQMDSENFIPYTTAVRTLDIEPRYAIHQPKKRVQQGFTDIIVPTGRKAFYQVLDALYRVCGVENFNVDTQQGNAVFSVRNGQYPSDFSSLTNLKAMQDYTTTGTVEIQEGMWIFSRTDRTVQLQLNAELHEVFKKRAEQEGLSVKAFLEQWLESQERELKKE